MPQSQPDPRRPDRIRPLRYVPLLLFLIGVAAAVRPFVAETYDMGPSIQEGDLVVGIPRPTWLFGPLRRGDRVVLPPGDVRDQQLRRVIGLPGEVVEVAGGRFLVDGVPLQSERLDNRDYTVGKHRTHFRRRLETVDCGGERLSYEVLEQDQSELFDRPGVKLGPDEYYLLADRRTGARDSRDYGPMKGAVLRRIYAPVFIGGYRYLLIGLR